MKPAAPLSAILRVLYYCTNPNYTYLSLLSYAEGNVHFEVCGTAENSIFVNTLAVWPVNWQFRGIVPSVPPYCVNPVRSHIYIH